MKSFLLSGLKRAAAGGREGLVRQHPGDWLVWEPGSWKAPRANTLVLGGAPQPPPAGPTKSAEALAIALPEQPQVTMGRDPDSELALNDGTLSSRHLCLHRASDGRWAIEDLGSTNGTAVEGLTLRPGERMPLRNGSTIKAGDVTLTFQTSEGLWKRLQA